jgi:hypothetical protein
VRLQGFCGTRPTRANLHVMTKDHLDTDKIDQTVLALLYLTLHDGFRAWKGFDWEALNRLHDKGMIGNPVGKAKSVALTDEGLRESERLFRQMFIKP